MRYRYWEYGINLNSMHDNDGNVTEANISLFDPVSRRDYPYSGHVRPIPREYGFGILVYPDDNVPCQFKDVLAIKYPPPDYTAMVFQIPYCHKSFASELVLLR
jgi:hypothetical protein